MKYLVASSVSDTNLGIIEGEFADYAELHDLIQAEFDGIWNFNVFVRESRPGCYVIPDEMWNEAVEDLANFEAQQAANRAQDDEDEKAY